MEIEAKRLRPGMVLLNDVNGVSGKPIVAKNTVLTEIEIEFIQKFLIETVNVSMTKREKTNPSIRNKEEAVTFQEQLKDEGDSFLSLYNEVAQQYKVLFTSWRANVPVNMYQVRELMLPLFGLVETKSLSEIKSLLSGRVNDLFYYKSVAVSLLSIKLAQLLNYDKKDWLQLGFAAILADIGLAKSKIAINSHEHSDVRHPALSYEMIKDEATVTQNAKIAIVQHHERLDGSGFPLKITATKIHPFACIVAVSDRYFTLYTEKGIEVERFILDEIGKLSGDIVHLLVES